MTWQNGAVIWALGVVVAAFLMGGRRRGSWGDNGYTAEIVWGALFWPLWATVKLIRAVVFLGWFMGDTFGWGAARR